MNKLGKTLFILGILVVLLGMLARLLLGEWITSVYALVGLGVAFLVVSIGINLPFYRDLLAMKTTRNGLSLGVVILLVATFLGAANYIGHARNKVWDLSSDKANSLSDQTISILKTLGEEVEFRGFFVPGANDQEDRMRAVFENLVKMYQAENSKVKLFIFDPFKRRDLTEKYKIITTGEVVISIGKKQTTVANISEQVFTNAIVKLTRNTKNIYTLVGHGEKDFEDSSPKGVIQFKKYLEDEGYLIQPLNLTTTGKMPSDIAVLLITGPTQSISDGAMKLIRDYISNGGRVLLTLDPSTKSNAIQLAQALGIEFQNVYIQDLKGRFNWKSSHFALGAAYSGTHEITSRIKLTETIFPLAGPLRKAPGAFAGITVDTLVSTNESAFTVKQLSEGDEAEPPPLQQYILAMAAKGKVDGNAKGEFSAVVVGDSDFLTNELIDVAGANRDFALNILASLSNDSEMITIRPKTAQGNPMVLTSAQNGGLVALIGFVPIFMFVFSFVAWWRRRGT